MRWTIEGADKQTGRECVLSVDADTRAAAMEYAISQGVLVADLHESIVSNVPDETIEPSKKAEPIVLVSPPEPEIEAQPQPLAAEPVNYTSPPRFTPAYTGLQVGGTMLFGLALLFYLTAFVCGCIFAWMVAIHWPDVLNQRLFFLGAAITAGLIAGLLHAASSACNALRGIARDVLRDVTRVVVATSGRDDSSNSSTIEGAGA